MKKRRQPAAPRNIPRHPRDPENRAARRAHLQPEAARVVFPERPRIGLLAGLTKMDSLVRSLEGLVDLFKIRLPGPPIAKPKRAYEEFHDAQGRRMLREVRVIDRRPLKEIRRTRREQVV